MQSTEPSRMLACPCCGLPTLSAYGDYEICTICWWEDDGQNDVTADTVRGGPNGKYSLAGARANFASHGHMYDKGKGIVVVEHPIPERLVLLDYVRAVLAGAQPLDEAKLRALIVADSEARDATDDD